MPSDLGKNNLVSVMQKQVHLEKPGTWGFLLITYCTKPIDFVFMWKKIN